MSTASSCELYLISPPAMNVGVFAEKLEHAFKGGRIASFQLRLKDTTDEEIVQASNTLIPICHQHGAQFILNDRADLALKVQADGVHIGDDDTKYKKARELLGANKVIGVSCYDSIDKAMIAGESGADYVSFGAFFLTKTKKPKANPSPKILSIWSQYSTIPCVAIGGIKSENCGVLKEHGADFIAVISSVWEHPKGPQYAVSKLVEQIK